VVAVHQVGRDQGRLGTAGELALVRADRLIE